MNPSLRWLSLMLMALVGITASGAHAQDEPTFEEQIDLSPLGRVAVHNEGRLKSFGSHANTIMNVVSGPRSISGQAPMFTYLDMMFRPEAYDDADCIYVKNKLVRNAIADAVLEEDAALEERMAGFRSSGLVSPLVLTRPEVGKVLSRMESDLIRTAKQVDAIRSAQFVMTPGFLLDRLRLVPPAGDDKDAPWNGMQEIMLLGGEGFSPEVLASMGGGKPIPGLDAARQADLATSWRQLVNGWGQGDAALVNASLVSLSEQLPSLNEQVYPDQQRLAWENWYFESDQMTRIWLIYLLATIFLLLAIVYRWRWALWTGLAIFIVAAGLQTFAVGLRWWISGRWPNANMFEAVTTASWFAVVLALVLEIGWLGRTAFRGLLSLGAAVTAMVALMVANFLPVYLNPNISNMMPVLHDIWLYIHTNVVIFAYAIIFMAAVTSTLYLLYRLFGGKAVYARAGGAGALVLRGPDGHTLADMNDPEGDDEKSRTRRRDRFGEILDGSTMILMELSFVMLWAGIVMGAIWADHSWGRPWGWDPKEVFALCTFIIFALLVHVRLKVRDKGLWTAILAVIGAGVMLFNWIVINFVITGLHSYA